MKTQPVDPKFLTARILDKWPKHDVVYGAAVGKDGKVYLGLSSEMANPGTNSRLLAYDPQADAVEEIADLADYIPEAMDPLRHPHSKLHTAICVGNDGKVYAATHMTAPPATEDYYHFWHAYNDPVRCFKGSHLVIHDPATKETRDFGIVSPKGGCRWMTYNPELEELYLTTFLLGHFMVIRPKTGEVKDMGRICQYDFMGPCYSACGKVFTTDCRGHLLRYDPKAETIEKLPIKIPNEPWRASDGNGVFHFLPGPDGVKLYGVGPLGRHLFEYDPGVGRHGQMRDLGTAWGEDQMDEYTQTPMIRTMAMGRDGRAYLCARYNTNPRAIAGAKPSISTARNNIVAIDPRTGEKQDYGLMQAEGLPPILSCVATATADDNTVYFATWKVERHLPIQLVLFRPEGVKQPPPPPAAKDWEKVQPDPKWSSPARHGYHTPSRECGSPFVTKGLVLARELGDAGRSIPFIPRNECAITALAPARNGAVYGATSGKRSHLFVLTPLAKRLMPMNVFGQGATACRCLVFDGQGRLFAATNGEGGGRLWMYDAPQHEMWLRRFDDMDRGEFSGLATQPPETAVHLEDLGAPVPGEGIRCIAMDPFWNQIHGLTWPGGKFFTYDTETGETKVEDIFDEHFGVCGNISRDMVFDLGSLYFAGKHGYLVEYLLAEEQFENTGLKIPVGAGREYLNSVTAFAKGPDGVIFGATYSDGYLFRFDPEEEELVNLGKPSSEGRIDALAYTNGRLWGLAGGEEQLTHLVRHDLRTGDMKDCGLLRAKMPKTWIVHKAEALAAGLDGELYVGETDAMSHLVIYAPPAPPKHWREDLDEE